MSILQKLGPGLITGAADDDPSGIATYSQAGSQFGFGLLWTLLLTFPLMVAIQMISAQIGCITGNGLATNIKKKYSIRALYCLVFLLTIANIINIAADLAAMGETLKLLIGGRTLVYAMALGIISLLLQVFVPYQRYVQFLKWLTLALLSYVATVFVIDIPWKTVVLSTVIPRLNLDGDYLATVVAVFGTTISPYLFFWQASQEVEELHGSRRKPVRRLRPVKAMRQLARIKTDTTIGMLFSNMVGFFIMLTAAVTLHAQGHGDIHTAAQAASALKPVAGDFAFWLFGLGIIGTGLLAIPVLAGSAGYAIAGTFNWKNSLDDEAKIAPKFYGVIGLATLLGLGLCFLPIDPFQALFWSAVINGVVAVPVMIFMMLIARDESLMGAYVIGSLLKFFGWACVVIMTIAVIVMLISYVI